MVNSLVSEKLVVIVGHKSCRAWATGVAAREVQRSLVKVGIDVVRERRVVCVDDLVADGAGGHEEEWND